MVSEMAALSVQRGSTQQLKIKMSLGPVKGAAGRLAGTETKTAWLNF